MRGKIKTVLMYFLICVMAPLSIGYVAGYMTGYSSLDKTVLASLLPGVISLIGLIVFAGIGTNTTTEMRALTSFCLIVLCVGVLLGLKFGAHAQEIDENKEKRKREAERIAQPFVDLSYRGELLKKCADLEQEVNEYRKNLKLAPLTSNKVCP